MTQPLRDRQAPVSRTWLEWLNAVIVVFLAGWSYQGLLTVFCPHPLSWLRTIGNGFGVVAILQVCGFSSKGYTRKSDRYVLIAVHVLFTVVTLGLIIFWLARRARGH